MSKEQRNLERMLATIAAARAGETSLSATVDSLLFLRSSLEETGDGWEPRFSSNLANLESAGLASEEQITEMGPAEFERLIGRSLADLEALVTEALAGLRAPGKG